jgi:hypothetical protein
LERLPKQSLFAARDELDPAMFYHQAYGLVALITRTAAAQAKAF